MLIRDVLINERPSRCRVQGGRIVSIDPNLRPQGGEEVVDGAGGALVPGLADHHIHLAATAAALGSTDLRHGGTSLLTRAPLDARGWVRSIGWDDEEHGWLDRHGLDMARPDAPVRVQHRSGALWVLNSAGLAALGITGPIHPGIEVEPDGTPTGRLWRCDAWLQDAVGSIPPDLSQVSRRLAAHGITHVTDASPDPSTTALVDGALAEGELLQHVQVLAQGPRPRHGRAVQGPLKIVIPDHDLPDPDALRATMAAARAQGRHVAVHCVSQAALAVALAAGLEEGDRVEHCAEADEGTLRLLAARRVVVVTQPSLALAREQALRAGGDEQLADLWPHARLLRAGIRTATSSDAPYGDLDPWAILRASTARVLVHERVTPSEGWRSLVSPLDRPGGAARRLDPDAPADLVLLDSALCDVLAEPHTERVRMTLVAGEVVYRYDGS